MKLSTTLRNLLSDAFGGSLDSGTIKFYTGSPPTSPQDSPTGTLLATFTFAADAFGASATGVATANQAATVQISTGGTAGWARIAKSDATTFMDCTVGTTGTDIIVDDPVFIQGNDLDLVTGTYTTPES